MRVDGRLKARYQRLVRRFGGHRNQAAIKKAIVAIAHTLCVIVWHLLHSGTDYTDLGTDFYLRRDNAEQRYPAEQAASAVYAQVREAVVEIRAAITAATARARERR